MFIISGNEDKRTIIWDHMKRQHTGDKVAVVGYKKAMPQTLLRNKQITFYESLRSEETLIEDGKKFLQTFEDHYEGIIFYVDCSTAAAQELAELAKMSPSKMTVTVLSEEPLEITRQIINRAA